MRVLHLAPLVLLAVACQDETVVRPVAWDEITGKPATFPATWAEVSDKPASFPAAWSDVAGVPASFPSDWSSIAGRPATFPTDPSVAQARVTGACPAGAAIAVVNEDGSVGCATTSRGVTVQLPAATWAAVQCASIVTNTGLAGLVQPTLRFDPAGACGTVRSAGNVLAIPLELASGPRPFRIRALASTLTFPGPVDLRAEWRVATAGSGPGAFGCVGSQSATVPALASVQAMAPVEFDFRADPSLCGEPGAPLVLSITRTDGAANPAILHAVHAVFE